MLDHAQHLIATGPPEPATVRVGFEGAHQIAAAVARVVGTLAEYAPTALLGDREQSLRSELLADLRELHRYLSTGTLLLEPAVHGLQAATGVDLDNAPSATAG